MHLSQRAYFWNMPIAIASGLLQQPKNKESKALEQASPRRFFLQGTSVENHCSHASPVSLCPQYKQLCILSTARGWVDVCRETNVLL